MRATLIDQKLENGRVRSGKYASRTGDLHGLFSIPSPFGTELKIMSSGVDSEFKWEHVSISTPRRTPNWAEMCMIKNLFWGKEEVVMQLHPAESEWVNYHQHTLHLWKPLDQEIPTPPSILVGPKG